MRPLRITAGTIFLVTAAAIARAGPAELAYLREKGHLDPALHQRCLDFIATTRF